MLTILLSASSARKLSGARKFPTPARLLCLSKHLCVLSIAGKRTTFHVQGKDLDMDKIHPITPGAGEVCSVLSIGERTTFSCTFTFTLRKGFQYE